MKSNLLQKIKKRLKQALWREKWNIAIARREDLPGFKSGKNRDILKLDLSKKKISDKFNWILKEKKNGFYADPFVIEHKNKTYVFFEELECDFSFFYPLLISSYSRGRNSKSKPNFATLFFLKTVLGVLKTELIQIFYNFKKSKIIEKGRISYAEIKDKNGKIVASKLKPVFEKKFHLSYPFLIKHQGEVYMIPEMAESNEIALYKAESFPNNWKKERVLVKNFAGVDSTIFFHENKYWLFCTKGRDALQCVHNSELHIFYSDDLLKGKWKRHKKNPVKTDLGSARPAGNIFEEKGKLYRPAQNCEGTYGKEIVLNEIVKLTPSEFKEREARSIKPNKNWRYNKGLHTLSFSENYIVIDAKRFAGLKRIIKYF